HLEAVAGTIGAFDVHRQHLPRLDVGAQPADRQFLRAIEPKRLARLAVDELQRQHAHADQVGAMDTLEAFGNHRFHAQQIGTLGGPVATGARAVFLAGDHHQWHALCLIAHRRIVDRQLFTAWLVEGIAAFLAAEHLVLDANVGEGAAHHHFMVAAPRAVGVEVFRLDAQLLQVQAGWGAGLDIASGRDVVGGDRVAEQCEDARVLDVPRRLGRLPDVLEEWRVLYIAGAVVPGVGVAWRHGDGLPVFVAREDISVTGAEHLPVDLGHGLAHFSAGGPDVPEVDGAILRVMPQRFAIHVDPRGTGQGECHHQRWRGQPVALDHRLHARLEAAA